MEVEVDLYRKQFYSHLLIHQARPISSSAVRMDQSYRIEADTFGELKVKKTSTTMKKIMGFVFCTHYTHTSSYINSLIPMKDNSELH